MPKRFRIIREQLHKKDPHCENCGVLTVLPLDLPYTIRPEDGSKMIKNFPDNMATIQHKYDKLHPKRNEHNQNERTLFLWCHKCNKTHWEQYEKDRANAHSEELKKRNNQNNE